MATTRFYHGENNVVLIRFVVTKIHTVYVLYRDFFCNILYLLKLL